MDYLRQVIDLFLHLDQHLGEIIQDYGVWTYLILFLVVFCETGLVITPFLPGDSLLFAAGAFCAQREIDGQMVAGPLDVRMLFLLLTIAAILGDTVNYWLGAYVGPKAFTSKSRFLKREHLERTHHFYERHGGKTIILARFIPIIRTFAPFVAGIGAMNYPRFIVYNVVGAVAWVAIFLFGGYWLSERLKELGFSFSWIILAIIIISVLPIAVEFARARWSRK